MINLIAVIAWKYPTKKVALVGEDWSNYSLIQWGAETPVSEAQLLLDAVDHAKVVKSDQIRLEASEKRLGATKTYLGTVDAEQIRTYEEKYVEAVAYLADNNSPTPIMTGEVASTGESVADLALLVKSQYETLKALLKASYGGIEGKRRKQLTDVAALTTVEAVEAYTTVW